MFIYQPGSFIESSILRISKSEIRIKHYQLIQKEKPGFHLKMKPGYFIQRLPARN